MQVFLPCKPAVYCRNWEGEGRGKICLATPARFQGHYNIHVAEICQCQSDCSKHNIEFGVLNQSDSVGYTCNYAT